MWNMRGLKSNSRSVESGVARNECGLVSEECFCQMLHVEQKRTERSGKCLVLMLMEFGSVLRTGKQSRAIEKALAVLSDSIRETDVRGWYKSGSILGVVFTEIVPAEASSVADVLLTKVRGLLTAALADQERHIRLSARIFPQDWDKGAGNHSGSLVPAELRIDHGRTRAALGAKRSVDVVGSLLALIAFSPFFAAIALAIKLTSKGPILFRQQRMGQYGDRFEFLKFRSMEAGNNHAIHQEFVKELIAGGAGSLGESSHPKPVYKLTNDPRVTPVGRFLRRTSLDELPQFLNVLKGQMSLVGPRPPIPYEVECYEIWHRRRLLAVKPGITGLWQVKGRSRTTFDEMVRLDLQYARTWSLWMDFRILLQTPRAMVSGDGAH
jgi:exopolysaccharide biosynthesis polyprenyl glycosylphosphotransferase